MELKLSGYVSSNAGTKKHANEDNYLMNGVMNAASKLTSESAWKPLRRKAFAYAAVLDGMGGGEGGQLASLLAAGELKTTLEKIDNPVMEEVADRVVYQGFLNANGRIVEERKKRSILGTTATVICIQGQKAKVYHLGDSRAYLLREGKLMQLTKDQTLAQLKIDAGIYNPGDVQIEKDKNLLTEYVGADETMISIRPLESNWLVLKPGDKILLCSDGLYHMCPDEQIKDILQVQAGCKELAERLVYKALEKGGTDNITCLVLQVGEV